MTMKYQNIINLIDNISRATIELQKLYKIHNKKIQKHLQKRMTNTYGKIYISRSKTKSY